MLVPERGTSFTLGRARVALVGPVTRHHADDRNDGLSLRIEYGDFSVLVMGEADRNAEEEIRSANGNIASTVLVAGRGGSDESTGRDFIRAVQPRIAILTGNTSWSVKADLEEMGCEVKDQGIVTVHYDGQNITVSP